MGLPTLASAELLDRSERNGFALLEFTVKLQVPQAVGRTVLLRNDFPSHHSERRRCTTRPLR